MNTTASTPQSEFVNIVRLIEEARHRAFTKVNAELVLLYFNIGKIVSSKVAAGIWGEGTVNALAKYIAEHMPRATGFNRRGLYRMKQFYETYSVPEFVSPLATQLESYFSSMRDSADLHPPPRRGRIRQFPRAPESTSLPAATLLAEKFKSTVLTQVSWANHLEILSGTKSPEEKFFYMVHCIKEKWTKRELRRQLATGYFERTMLSSTSFSARRPHVPTELFKDPYIFEFLNLPDAHSENELENALITNLQKFIIEIGKGFTYAGNQFRLQVGNKDYFSDLLFYNRDLQCLVLFELKIEEFQPEFLGKLNFYLEALDRDVRRPHENPSIGILLCKGRDTEVVEYAMARTTSPALIADYETKLIDKKILADKLHQLVKQLSIDER